MFFEGYFRYSLLKYLYFYNACYKIFYTIANLAALTSSWRENYRRRRHSAMRSYHAIGLKGHQKAVPGRYPSRNPRSFL